MMKIQKCDFELFGFWNISHTPFAGVWVYIIKEKLVGTGHDKSSKTHRLLYLLVIYRFEMLNADESR